jgi:hypothetical protein
MSFASVIDAVTRVVIVILLAVATVIVVFGLIRACLSRRRFELVITDIVVPKELSASLIAELSEELRSMVHHRLVTPIPRHESLKETVGRDVADHIAGIPGISENDVNGIQDAILQAPRHELLASPRDVLTAVSGGIRALKPDQAEGFIQALSAILPEQRGLLVDSRVVCRRETDGYRMGLSVQVGPLSHGTEARATFWSQDLMAAEADLSFARPSWFSELLSLAAEWITVYLIGTLGVEGSAPQRHLRPGHRRYVKQRHALLDILTAEWASYAIYDLQTERPDVALEWADQALEDAQQARDSLPTYYYPSYLVGSINDLWGSCYVGLSERAPDNETYRSQASEYFKQAAEAFAEAQSKLEALAGSKTFRQWNKDEELSHRIEEMRIAWLKDQMLGNGRKGLTALDNTEIIPFDLESTINVACLFAVAAWVADENGLNASTYRLRACRYVVESVRQDPSVGFLRTDKDLNRGIARTDLDWLLDDASNVDDRTKEERLSTIAARRPIPAPKPPPPHERRNGETSAPDDLAQDGAS